ncbi:MAG: ABC transporter permease [Dehalococcoidia bacterium]
MKGFIIRSLISTLAVMLIVSVLIFLLIYITPGDPVRIMLGMDASPEQVAALRSELWLDRPLPVQYGHWLSNILQGDFGRSLRYQEGVTSVIATRVPVTGYISLLSLIISVFVGILTGTISAIRRGSALDQFVSVMANAGIAIPIFWLGILGIYGLGLKLGWLPIQGFTPPTTDFWQSTRQLIMPVICMAVPSIAILSRQTRSSMLEVTRQDYIRTAWAKGLKERVVVLKHGLKNALIPVVTLVGLQVRTLIGGAVLVETIFNIPGMGRLMVQAVLYKDFPLLQAVTLLMALIVSLANLLVDLSYGWLDPRVRYE